MRSRILSLILCIAAFAVTMALAMNILSPDANVQNRETKEQLTVEGAEDDPVFPAPTTSAKPKPPMPSSITAVNDLSEDLEKAVERLAYGADKSYLEEFDDLLGRLSVCSEYLATTVNDNAGSVYLKTIENIFTDVLEKPFADNNSFSNRVSVFLKDLDAKLPPEAPSSNVDYPKFDTDPNGSFALAMLSVYRQQAVKSNSITISVGGQLTVGDAANNIATPFEFNYSAAEGNYPLQGISPLFATDSLTLTALSNPLTDATEGKDNAVKGKPAYAQGLKNSGVDISLLVGTHLNDYGDTGISDTILAYSNAGMKAMAFSQTTYVDSAVGKIAILTYDLKNNLIDPVKADIATARSNGAKLVIVVFNRTSTDAQAIAIDGVMAQSCRGAIDNGADLVVNYSQSVIQTIDVYKGKYVVYSPSVLYASADRSKQDNGNSFIFQQTFTLDGDTVKASLLSITPVDNGSVSDSAPRLLLDEKGDAAIADILKSSPKSKYGIKENAISRILIKK